MSTSAEFVEFIIDHLQKAEDITYRKMFGEYGVFSKGKIVALICDNLLFVKPTEAGRNFIGKVTEAPPYPGAKPAFLIDDKLDDTNWLSELIRVSEKELPEPKKRKRHK